METTMLSKESSSANADEDLPTRHYGSDLDEDEVELYSKLERYDQYKALVDSLKPLQRSADRLCRRLYASGKKLDAITKTMAEIVVPDTCMEGEDVLYRTTSLADGIIVFDSKNTDYPNMSTAEVIESERRDIVLEYTRYTDWAQPLRAIFDRMRYLVTEANKLDSVIVRTREAFIERSHETSTRWLQEMHDLISSDKGRPLIDTIEYGRREALRFIRERSNDLDDRFLTSPVDLGKVDDLQGNLERVDAYVTMQHAAMLGSKDHERKNHEIRDNQSRPSGWFDDTCQTCLDMQRAVGLYRYAVMRWLAQESKACMQELEQPPGRCFDDLYAAQGRESPLFWMNEEDGALDRDAHGSFPNLHISIWGSGPRY